MIYNLYYAIFDSTVLLDIILTALIIGFIYALVYMLFIESMNNDRADAIRKKYFGPNLWDKLSDKKEETTNKITVSKKSLITSGIILILIIILAIIRVIITP